MTPRTDMQCFDLTLTYEENLEMIKEYKYTRYPVCRGDKDQIEGFIHIKDLYWMDEKITGTDYEKLPIRDIDAVSETLSLDRLLQTMQNSESKFALVVDEYGGTAGIVTSSDVMSQIVGNIDELIGFEPDKTDECETAAGLVLNIIGKIPIAGDRVAVEHKNTKVTFTVIHMEKHRIDKIGVKIERKHLIEEETDSQ